MKDRASCVMRRVSRRVVRAVFAAAVVAGCGNAWADVPASAYVQRGLVVQFDGIENAGAGQHDAAATTWIDLTGNGRNGTITGSYAWLGNGLQINSVSDKGLVKFNASHAASFTLDLCIKVSKIGSYARIIGENAVPSLVCTSLTASTPYLYGLGSDGNLATSPTYDASKIHTTALTQSGVGADGCEWYHDGVFFVHGNRTGTTTGTTAAYLGNRVTDYARGIDCVYYSVRVYSVALTPAEVALNAALDKVRFDGADVETALPDGYRYDAEGRKISVRWRTNYSTASGTVKVGGATVRTGDDHWVDIGTSLTFTAEPADGMEFVRWSWTGGTLTEAQKASATVTVSATQPIALMPVFRPAGGGTPAVRLSARSYVLDGLICLLDGQENAGFGQAYQSAATTWTDLSGNGLNLPLKTASSFATDRYGLAVQRAGGMKFSNWTKMFEAYKAASYTCEVAYDKTIETPNSSQGYKNTRCAFLCLGHSSYVFGTVTDKTVGLCPNGASSVNTFGKTLTVATTLGQHTCSALQDGLYCQVNFDELNPAYGTVAALTENPSTAHGFCLNREYYTDSGLDGYYHSVRVYDRPLSETEQKLNRAVDRVRYFGADALTLDLPDGWMFDFSDGVRLMRRCQATVSPAGAGTVSVDGFEASASQIYWVEKGGATQHTLTAVPAEGYAFVGWGGDMPDTDKFSQTVTTGVSGDVVAVFRKTGGGEAYTYTLIGGADAKWGDRFSWHDQNGIPGVPVEGDSVVIPEGKSIVMDIETPAFASFEVNGTLRIADWTNRVSAADVTIGPKGVVSPAAAFDDESMSNRVWIVCDRLTVAAGGKIDADQLGYVGQNGPGAAVNLHDAAAHGGTGGTGSAETYGSPAEPSEPGSGGGFDRGGGVIFIEADKSIEIKKDGLITADSKSDASPWDSYCGTGSAGAIVLKTRKIFGKGSVTAASGCYPGISKNGYHGSGPGGGGRVAIYCVPRLSVTNELFVAAPAGKDTASHKAAEAGTVYWGDATKIGLVLIVR